MSTGLASCTDVERLLLHSCNQGPRSSQEKPALALALDYKLVVDPPLMSATITDLCSEPLFFNSYLSDEEDSSASETDDMSFSTGTSTSLRDDELEDDFDATLPELLAEECTLVEQPCSKAQAVSFVAAGRPKMIQVAKIDIHLSPVIARSSTVSGGILPRSVSSKNSVSTFASSRFHSRGFSRTSSSTSHSVPSTPGYPSTPLLESGLRTPMSACTPRTPNTPDSRFGQFDPLMSPSPSETFSIPTSKQYHFDRPQMVKRSKTSFPSFGRPLPSPPLSAPPIYSYAPKKVARAADDRPRVMELPPFPSDAELKTIKPSRPWALRKDSFGAVSHKREESTSSTRSRMRKVESAIGLNRR